MKDPIRERTDKGRRLTDKQLEALIDDPGFGGWVDIRRELYRARASEKRLLQALKAVRARR
jgi:hypothetical protein